MGTTNFIFSKRRFMQKTMISRYASFRSVQPTTAQVRLFEMLGKAFLQQMRLLPWSHLSKTGQEADCRCAALTGIRSGTRAAGHADAALSHRFLSFPGVSRVIPFHTICTTTKAAGRKRSYSGFVRPSAPAVRIMPLPQADASWKA